MVTMNDDVTDSETDIDDDMEPLMTSSHYPHEDDHMIQSKWQTRTYQLLYDRTCCCYGCDLKSESVRLSKQDLLRARDKFITMVKLMMDRRVLLATSLYGLLGFAVIIINEVCSVCVCVVCVVVCSVCVCVCVCVVCVCSMCVCVECVYVCSVCVCVCVCGVFVCIVCTCVVCTCVVCVCVQCVRARVHVCKIL